MGRKALYQKGQFIDAALDLLAGGGPPAVTIAAVAKRAGAPVGSVYHRFPSRDVLLAELWLRIVASFQEGFLKALGKGDGVGAALYTPRWVRKQPREGKILLMYRRDELTSGEWPEDLRNRALCLWRDLEDGINAFVKQRYGLSNNEHLNRAVFALIDVPCGAVRRYMEADQLPPEHVDRLLRETCEAIMGMN